LYFQIQSSAHRSVMTSGSAFAENRLCSSDNFGGKFEKANHAFQNPGN